MGNCGSSFDADVDLSFIEPHAMGNHRSAVEDAPVGEDLDGPHAVLPHTLFDFPHGLARMGMHTNIELFGQRRSIAEHLR